MARKDAVDTADTARAKLTTPEIMTVEQAAAYLQVNPKTLYRWLALGVVPGVRLGGKTWRVPRDALDAWFVEGSREQVRERRLQMRRTALEELRRLRKQMTERRGEPLPSGYGARLIEEGRR